MKAYMCVICGYVYEEEKGDPASGIAPGTRWDDVPLSWRCPDCGAGKEDFEMIEVVDRLQRAMRCPTYSCLTL